MKRDPRLQGLSSEHHSALVLARDIGRYAPEQWRDEAAKGLWLAFERELEPHFCVEEELLLPALRRAGEVELADQTQADHDALRQLARAAGEGDFAAARGFAERLTAHVRFEERQLFPSCESVLPSSVLDAVARRAPK